MNTNLFLFSSHSIVRLFQDKWSAPQSDVVSVCSLTPSVISSPKGDQAFSPTGTPLNSPAQTPPDTPSNDKTAQNTKLSESPGFVAGFFASLRSALYGEQQKEAQAQILKRRKKRKPVIKRLGILEKVEEVGVERFMSASPAPSSLDDDQRSENFWASLSNERTKHYKPDLLSDELEEIEPGTLTVSRGALAAPKLSEKSPSRSTTTGKPKKTSKKDSSPVAGQLKPPVAGQLKPPVASFSMFAPPDPVYNDSVKYPSVVGTNYHSGGLPSSVVGGRGPGRVISPCEKRPNLPGVALGVPGQPGTGALRSDLGFVPVTSASVNRYYRAQSEPEQTSFIGSIAQMFFGRKGGLF